MIPEKQEQIPVTQPFMPPLEEFLPYLERIWENKWLTNNGEFHKRLELALADYLEVDQLSLVCNGTIALILALRALGITGEVITTPFSFVATSHALQWCGIRPVFVDIDPTTFTLDPTQIEAAITPATTAILPVHVYGIPCDIAAIQRIADAHGLKVIYDAAHAFGVGSRDRFMNAGDASVLSFHATKVFSTFEGGAIVTRDAKLKEHIDFLRNFGFLDEITVVGLGINGKMNEIQAAFGLLQLSKISHVLDARRLVAARYRAELAAIRGLRFPQIPDGVVHNGAYFPVVVEPGFGISRDDLYLCLRRGGIHARRYFYPLISNFPLYRELASAAKSKLPVANRIAERILCLPIYATLGDANQQRVVGIIRDSQETQSFAPVPAT